MNKDHLVIAVSSISGGGKSAVVHKLVEMLDDSIAIQFDDYETPETYPKSLAVLIQSTFDFNEIKSPLLAEHLNSLKKGKKVTSPKTGEEIFPAKHIIFESPLGRAQQETGQYIDYLVFIDTPLEVGLARRISRNFGSLDLDIMNEEELRKQLIAVGQLAENYMLWMRKAYLLQLELVKPKSDLILDWNKSIEDLTKVVINALHEENLIC